MSHDTAAAGTREATEFDQLLDLLGIEPTDRVSICSMPPGGKFCHVTPDNRADATALALSTPFAVRDVWFSVNPVAVPAGYLGRGADEHVTRCAALFADIDIKPGGVSDSEAAQTVAKAISEALGQFPAAVVFTGHGGHVYWTLDFEDDAWTLDTEAKRAAAQAVYRRFHRLCADIAASFGGTVDNVGQLSRILRVPGTYNRKDPADPIRVKLWPYPFDAAGPLTHAEVIDALDAYGVPEYAEDRERLGVVRSEPAGWEFGDQTSPYVATMTDEWRTDTPRTGIPRHNWMVSQSVRLACAHRLGRITDDDHAKAVQVLTEAFNYLLAHHGQPRIPTPGEVSGALAWGVTRAATFSDDRAADEIGGQVDDAPENLPESFWEAHPRLKQIRDSAHRRVDSADAVLGAGLALLAAHVGPKITVYTGIKDPMTLNMFVGLVGSSGTGKSSAFSAASRIFEFDVNPHEYDPPMVLPVGSGPGVAEAFMDKVIDPQDPNGKQKLRMQVRHKLVLHSDEGAGLVSKIIDTHAGNNLGPTLRSAWTGAVIGEANASDERKREVRDYSIGLCVGFQLEALADLSTPEQMEYGTPQRFLYVSAPDPSIPDIPPPDPGRLIVKLPKKPLEYCAELQAKTRREALARARGEADDLDPMDAHRPAMKARLAALLVVLCDPDRELIEQADVDLAETLLDASTRLHAKAMAWRREREADQRERRTEARISEQVATAARVHSMDDELNRLGNRILTYLAKDGGSTTWKGRDRLKQKFNSEERATAYAALRKLESRGEVIIDGDKVSLP